MLFLNRAMLLLMLCFTTAVVTAQQVKTPVFAQFPSSIEISESVLANATQMSKGQQSQLNFGDLIFSGIVISNTQVFENLQTIIIKSSEYNNALLQVSKQILEDKSVAYVGRIFSEKSADGYHIKRANGGGYSLQKFEAAVIKQDCNQ